MHQCSVYTLIISKFIPLIQSQGPVGIIYLSWVPHSHQNYNESNLALDLAPRPDQGEAVWSLTGHIEVDESLVLAHLVEDHTLVHGGHVGILYHQLAHSLGKAQAQGSILSLSSPTWTLPFCKEATMPTRNGDTEALGY